MSICVGLFGHFQWDAELFDYVVCLFFGCFGHFVLIFSASSVCTDWLFLHAHWPLRCCSFLSVFMCSVLECSPGLHHTCWFFYVLSQSAVRLIQSFQFHLLHSPTEEPHFGFFFLKNNSYLLINIHFYLFIIVIHFFKYTLFGYISNILFEVLFYFHLS